MRAKFINEMKFERTKSEEDFRDKLLYPNETERQISLAINDLKKLNINVEIGRNYGNENIIELNIPDLEDYLISYLPEEEKNWFDDESWGWGIYRNYDGAEIISGKPWKNTLKMILKLLNK